MKTLGCSPAQSQSRQAVSPCSARPLRPLLVLFCAVLLCVWSSSIAFAQTIHDATSPARESGTPSYAWQCDPSGGPACFATLNAVDMVSLSDGWAVGEGGMIIHWNGIQWRQVASPTAASLKSVAMVSASDGWAVGEDSHDQGVILRWNGAAWQKYPSPTPVGLTSISMVSSNDGWATGYGNDPVYGGMVNNLLRWDGIHWTVYARNVGANRYGLNAISMSAANYGWAVSYGWGSYCLVHWNGIRWGYGNYSCGTSRSG